MYILRFSCHDLIGYTFPNTGSEKKKRKEKKSSLLKLVINTLKRLFNFFTVFLCIKLYDDDIEQEFMNMGWDMRIPIDSCYK